MTVRILHGDCRQVLKSLPDESVHCCVTSPPYWGLRSYLPDGHADKHLEIGSEPTLQAWVQTMVEVFREVRRVLRPDGTLWLNLGDAYAGSRCGGSGWPGSTLNGKQPDHSRVARATHQAFTEDHKASSAAAKRIQRMSRANGGGPQNANLEVPRSDVKVPGLKPKDLMGQPWRVAFALQDDGWWLRQEIIWHKPNPMPESTRDRCTKAHEHVFLLSKSERYFYDFDAMQESATGGTPGNVAPVAEPPGQRAGKNANTRGGLHAYAERQRSKRNSFARETKYSDGEHGQKPQHREGREDVDYAGTRNPRSVWTIPTHAFKGAHFATFPPALAERCITAGCPVGGTVLDPFGGSGTVGLVAERQHKSAILIDLDERNVPMATERITAESPLFAEVATS